MKVTALFTLVIVAAPLGPYQSSEARASNVLHDPARPAYHYTRPYGWQNDPVPYRDPNTGVYHLFPLCDPNATTQWQLPSDHTAWCHATSPDMVTKWTTHQPALMSGQWPGYVLDVFFRLTRRNTIRDLVVTFFWCVCGCMLAALVACKGMAMWVARGTSLHNCRPANRRC